MKPITRICCFFLLLYPFMGMCADVHREIFVYIHEPHSYWDYHDPVEAGINNLVSLIVSTDFRQTKHTQELQEGNHWYRFEIEQEDFGLSSDVTLNFRSKNKILTIPKGEASIIIAILNEKVFPYEVKVFQKHEVLGMINQEKLNIEGKIFLGSDAEKVVSEKVALILPFADWPGVRTYYEASLEADLEWEYAAFNMEASTIFSTLAFIRFQDRYYPIMAQPGHHYELKWIADNGSSYLAAQDRRNELEEVLAEVNQENLTQEEYNERIKSIIEELDQYSEIIDRSRTVPPSEYLRLETIEEAYYHGVDPQEFFNERYPYGLPEEAYNELVNAFMGDLSTRADTLFVWSRAIVDFYKTRDADPEELLMHINQIGKYSKKDLFIQGYENFVERKWEKAQRNFMNWSRLILIVFITSIFGYVSIVFLRLIRSRFVQLKHLNFAELLLFCSASATFLYHTMRMNHHGILEIANISAWVLVASPLLIFFFNVKFLVPNLLIEKRWGLYLVSVMGLTLAYFIVGVGISFMPFDHYGLCFVDGEWRWIEAIDKFHPNFRPNNGIIIHAVLIAIAPAYGLGRHFLFSRMPRLQEQKSALKAELTNLKAQISPHFFFNSLNTIYSFALSEDSPRTAEAITKLSDMMRFAIYHGDQDVIPLEKELDYLTDYIELQRLRLHPVKHELIFRTEGEAEGLNIAPLLLITLVENAFKHGISMSHESFIHIDLFIQSEGLILTVENSVHSGKLMPMNGENPQEGGLGLINTQQRLDLLYKGRYEWSIEEQEDRYFTQLSLDLIP